MDKVFIRRAFLLGSSYAVLMFAAFAGMNSLDAKAWPFVDTFGAFPLAMYVLLAGAAFGLAMAKIIESKGR